MIPKVGERFSTNYGYVVVKEYENAHRVLVEYDDGTLVYCCSGNLTKGSVKNCNAPKVCGKGAVGSGEYSPKKDPVAYECWRGMIRGCYDMNEPFRHKNRAYSGCDVDSGWLNFQMFAPDYYKMLGANAGWHLEKDILVKGNKLYSRDTCVMLPQELNKLFTKRESCRGDFPIGVSFHKLTGKFQASCNNGSGKNTYLALCGSPEEAFNISKAYKEKLIKQLAAKWRSQIDPRAYEALMNYKVEITD